MQKAKAEGRRVLQLHPIEETLSALSKLAEITGGSAKSEAEMILRRGVGTAIKEVEALAARMAPIYRESQRYTGYSRYLEQPGSTFRVGQVTLRAADWHALAHELARFYETTRRWGWSKGRATAFLERSKEIKAK